jgi:hypothetical protein
MLKNFVHTKNLFISYWHSTHIYPTPPPPSSTSSRGWKHDLMTVIIIIIDTINEMTTSQLYGINIHSIDIEVADNHTTKYQNEHSENCCR